MLVGVFITYAAALSNRFIPAVGVGLMRLMATNGAPTLNGPSDSDKTVRFICDIRQKCGGLFHGSTMSPWILLQPY